MRSATAVVLLLAVACNRPSEKPEQAAAKPTAAEPTAAAAPHDEAAIIDRSKQFLQAVDTADADVVAAMLADGFTHVIPSRFYPADFLLSRLRARKQRGFPRYSDREYDLTSARFYGDTAIVTTTTSATLLRAEGVVLAMTTSTLTFVWSWQGGAWRLTTWNEVYSGPEMQRIAWNLTYRDGGGVNLDPNQLLIDTVHGRKPGKALDLGIGQGRNALYLASQGWDVTGVDISDEGIAQALEAAKAAGLDAKLHTQVADLETVDFGENQYDLVGFIYMGPNPPVDKIRRALKRGGIVVVEFFGIDAVKGTGIGGLRQGDLTALFEDGFKVLRDEEVVDDTDWGPHGRKPLVRFVAEKL